MCAFGYTPTGRRNHDAKFHTEDAIVHELTKMHLANKMFQLEYFPRDISFFISGEEDRNDDELVAEIVRFCNMQENVFDCALLDEFAFQDGRKSKV